jgi:hypothetical protein
VRRSALLTGLAAPLTALALAALALAAPTASAQTPQQAETAADWGAGCLGRLVTDGGFVPDPGGDPDRANTMWTGLALVAAGVGAEQVARIVDFLEGGVDATVQTGGADDPGKLATLILLVSAAGEDPAAFAGTDLVARLRATEQTTGPDAGLFGSADATYDGAYRQSLALLALEAAGTTDAEAVAWLRAEQCETGGWMGNNPDHDPATPCPGFDFTSFVGQDSNGTALATVALAAHGATPAFDPFDFLAEVQNGDGGFGFVPGFGSDANSTALALQAIDRAGDDPTTDWAAPDGNPVSFLLSLQLPNPPASTAGAFAFQRNPDGSLTANTYATAQVVPALAGEQYPLEPRVLSATLPLRPAAQQPTPTPSSSTPTPAPTTTTPPATDEPAPLPAVQPTLVATGGRGAVPWDTTGKAVLGLGLVGYGVAGVVAARLLARRRTA